jgi:hypothetical protein
MCCTLSVAQSQTSETTNGAAAFAPNLTPSLEIRRVAAPIRIDGQVDDAGWQGAARATNFAEIRPGDQAKPPVETEALIAYDDTHLYLALIAQDDPQTIRSSLRDRDQMWSDDFVGIMLDTYGDGAWAYEIFANPLGIQGDARWTPQNEDDGFNIIFESKGKVTETGYQVEMAVPFSSLRFPDKPAQIWRATFFRTHPRDSRRQYSWATVSRDNPCFPCQFGTLVGIENVKPGGKLEVLPSIVSNQTGEIRNSNDANSGLKNSKIDGEAGLGLQYSFTPSLIAEATYNPDFSQVESDAAQIDINTPFALFYPERRPFFQEGSDLFDTWYNAFYTRSINNPSFAGKLTGRANRSSVAYLVARDENTPFILPFEDRSAVLATNIKSTSNVFRFRQTFLEDSYVGALATDRRIDGGGSGTLIGADGILRFLKNYRFEWQALYSRTEEPNNTALYGNTTRFDGTAHSSAFDGESFDGSAVYASFERDARHWNFDFDYWASTPTFRADNGFVFRNDDRRATLWTGYTLYPNTKLVDRYTPSIVLGRFWNTDGVRKDNFIVPGINLQFKAQTNVNLSYVISTERFNNIVFDGIRRVQLNVNSDFSNSLTGGFYLEHGRLIARREDPPVLGRGTNFQIWATMKPLRQLIIQPEFAYFTLEHPNGTEIASANVLRTRINYQFTRELFLRMVVQYSQEEQGGRQTDKGLNIEPLLSYKLNPFTIFYIGSTHAYRELGQPSDLTQTSRQFFMKFQYLFRI